MVSTDPIADMLSRIRNAAAVGKTEVSLPHSGIKEVIARILAANNFIDTVEIDETSPQKLIKIRINDTGSNARISEVTRLSKPGRRLYAKADEIPVIKRGRGIVIISTSNGVMSGQEARNKRLGGELICEVY